MPCEIADSDDDSDFNSPIKSPAVPEDLVGDTTVPSQPSLSGYDFDQFLDPTQRLSDLSPSQRQPDMRFRSSISLLDGTSEPVHSATARSKKRPHSDLLEISNDFRGSSGAKESGSKKPRVYGHPARSRTVHDIELFAGTQELSPERTRLVKDGLGQSISDPPRESNATNGSLSTDLTIPSGMLSLIGQSTTDGSHRLTTSVASMGRYESLNLDFRGSGQGLDVNANPFGSLSQVSLNEDPNSAEAERFASMFQASEELQHLERKEQSSAGPDIVLFEDSLFDPPQAELGQAMVVDPTRLMQHDGATFDSLSEGHGPGNEATVDVAAKTLPSVAVTEESDKPQPKKRGRKPKNSRVPSQSPAPGVSEDVERDELALPNMPPPNRPRRGTLDSLSQAPQAPGNPAPVKKRKRGQSEEIPDEEEHEKLAAESPPTKQPTSELNLSDEAMIGLPKEQYKPRPSRSRSKRVIDEEDTILLPPSVPEAKHDTPAKTTAADGADDKEQTPAITPAKASVKKSGRKSKVKRAKTSAAALLKKADPMLSEGEEDVVWMDTKPAPVKLDLPPDLKVLKKEADAPKEEDGQETRHDGPADTTTTNEGESKITIEIPLAAEIKDPVAGPKKRGRKPKKVPSKEETWPADDESQDIINDRPALAEKEANVPSMDVGDFSPKAPTVSPISVCDLQPPSASPEKENNPSAASALTTPSKPAAEKGPTKHSPINALNLSCGRKVIYRVGLSKRQHIPSLLRKVQRDKPPPKVVVRKEPKGKKDVNLDLDNDGEGEGGSGLAAGELRGADGMLIEWGD
ncbi:hypothetical protein A1O1_09189 [Capronia coronata CBS 617.96]|uniref:Uncharacterized protein n=1 Tax=Capronia coronata CBS 617.96 TaxID=1182541 RepID=W9XE99_9EURO|nr:uncharacterized protein A1O1_09189 [Capronia coronata CBS 617.96]EXJ78787.1 hypothetical protein A1O1_09189 [Capronia coronata CBS 617.96]